MGKTITNYNNFQGNKEQKEAEARTKHLTVVLAVMSVCYYLVPFLLLSFVPIKIAGFVMLISIISIFTMAIFVCCFSYTRLHGVTWYLPIMLWLLFIPSAMIYRYSIWIILFSIIFIIFGYLGTLVSYLLCRRQRMHKAPLGMKTLENLSNREKGNKL